MRNYEIAVLGGGPAGYVAAIRAAKEGRQVVLIEKDHLGGTCLNRGCIPSKTLLHQAGLLGQIRQAKSWGIETGELSFSLEKMLARKDQVIKRLRTGIAALLKAGRIDVIDGWGQVNQDKTITVQTRHEQIILQANRIILATGSTPAIPPISGLADVTYYTSDTIFDIEEVPSSIVILGGGFIGVEFASIFSSLGSQVTVIEMAERLIPGEDADAAAVLSKALQKKGVSLRTGHKVTAIARNDAKTITVHMTDNKGDAITIQSEALLVATGRKPNLAAFEKLQPAMNGAFVRVNDYLETSISGVYAAGDITGGYQLAHVASAEGQVAAINAAGGKEKVNYKAVPRCIYTHPEIASTGMSEEEAKARGFTVKTTTYHHAGNGKALASDDAGGFTKLIADVAYGEVLGVVMVGPHVTEIIATGSSFLLLEATIDDVAGMMFPHPTVSESMMEAAAKWSGKGIHT